MSTPEELKALALEGDDARERLADLDRKLKIDRASGFNPAPSGEVNNHIHTVYSFSPYTPAEAAYGAWRSGLDAAGIIDHESVGGCEEMLAAGEKIGLPITVGCELRVNMDGSPLEGRRINNPDSLGLAYMVIHGIPHQNLPAVEAFLAPIRRSRDARMARQVSTLNAFLSEAGKQSGLSMPQLDFEKDVAGISRTAEGGSITERHILFALAKKMAERFGRGEKLIDVLGSGLGLNVTATAAERLVDNENPHFLYDLLGLFKGSLVPRFFEQPDGNECPPVRDATGLAERIGAIACYPYLGDVGESPTGDKKAEKYEDDWLDELFEVLPGLGFRVFPTCRPGIPGSSWNE